MLLLLRKKRKGNRIGQALKDIPKVRERTKNDDKATFVFPNQCKQFYEKDDNEPQKPFYTSVAWLDEDTIAVVDQRNQKLKLILREKGVVKTTVIKKTASRFVLLRMAWRVQQRIAHCTFSTIH